VLEDFRRLDLVRNGHTQTVRSRFGQDKGHRAEWAAFAKYLQGKSDAPIRFEEIVCSTLATLRVNESVAAGERLAVNTAAFLREALQSASDGSSQRE